jgi:sRNA-binding carbon storage regulator CsrA
MTPDSAGTARAPSSSKEMMMPRLFLTRGIGEAVLIGKNVRVTVNAFKAVRDSRGQMHIELEFIAPRDVKILRAELVDRPEVGRSGR